MKTSTEIASAARYLGEERVIEQLAKAGFDAWDFSMFSMCNYDWNSHTVLKSNHPLAGSQALAFARKLKQVGLDHGIVCNQSHAPFPSYCPEIRSHLKLAIECTAEAGGQICVIHPDNYKSAEENAEMYLELLPFAKEHGVKIAAENMWNWDSQKAEVTFAACATPESFLAHLDAVHDPSFVACLDIGHAEMQGCHTSAVEMIHALGAHLQALHVHDNDQCHDSHQIPFSMKIDFAKVVRALKDIGYQGYLTLEADCFITGGDEEMIGAQLRQLARTVRKLAEMYEA